MALTHSKHKLSGSTNGRGVQVVATATAGTTIHTDPNTATTLDEVWLWASNHRGEQEDLVIEFGGAASGDRIEVGLPPQAGLIPILPGLVISGGVSIAAFTTTASAVSIFGFVNRISGTP